MHDSEAQIVARYISRLKPLLQDGLSMFMVSSLSEAHQRALLLEQQATRRQSRPLQSSSAPVVTPIGRAHLPASPQQQTSVASTGGGPSSSTRCFNCREVGHRRSSCPKLRSIRTLLTGDGIADGYEGPPVFDVDPMETLPEEHVEGDTGPCLVI